MSLRIVSTAGSGMLNLQHRLGICYSYVITSCVNDAMAEQVWPMLPKDCPRAHAHHKLGGQVTQAGP